jgi:hypothetical protein
LIYGLFSSSISSGLTSLPKKETHSKRLARSPSASDSSPTYYPSYQGGGDYRGIGILEIRAFLSIVVFEL